MASTLRNAARYYIVTEDEFKRIQTVKGASEKAVVGPVAYPTLNRARRKISRMMDTKASDDDPSLKAQRYESLVSQYFNDLERLAPQAAKRLRPPFDDIEPLPRDPKRLPATPPPAPLAFGRQKKMSDSDSDGDASERGAYAPLERKRRPSRRRPYERAPRFARLKREESETMTEGSDDDDDKSSANRPDDPFDERLAERVGRREALIEEAKILPEKLLRSRRVSPKPRYEEWVALDRKKRRASE